MTSTHDIAAALNADLCEAEAKAWDSLARYKFLMFGYWAAIWVHQNRASGQRLRSPFAALVALARTQTATNPKPAPETPTPPKPASPVPPPRTPEDGRRPATPEDGQPVTTR